MAAFGFPCLLSRADFGGVWLLPATVRLLGPILAEFCASQPLEGSWGPVWRSFAFLCLLGLLGFILAFPCLLTAPRAHFGGVWLFLASLGPFWLFPASVRLLRPILVEFGVSQPPEGSWGPVWRSLAFLCLLGLLGPIVADFSASLGLLGPILVECGFSVPPGAPRARFGGVWLFPAS